MKTTLLACICFFLISCSESPESPPLKKSGKKEEAQRTNSYEPVGKPLTKPRVEVMEVTQSEVTLHWFDPSNWQSDPGYPSQPVFLVEASTNPKFDNLVIEREISDSHQTTFSNLQIDTPHHFRVTALSTPGDPRFLQGESTVVTVLTASYPSEQIGGFVVNPEPGKVHFSWSELEQPGPIDFVIHLLDDSESQQPFREFVTRETEIRNVELQGGQTYWAKFRAAPAEDNDAFTTTEEITIQFEVPGNFLPLPQNITVIDRNGTLELQWSPVTSNLGEVSYMIDVKTGQTFEDLFGNFVQKEARIRIPDAKPYGRFSFAIKCFPDAGNYSDLQGPSATHTFDFPVVYCPTPTKNQISRPSNEPSSLKISLDNLPDAPPGHRYEIEVASDPEFSVGIDRRTLEGNELETEMTGRVPEETHYVRIRMIGPEDDATVIASSWTDIIVVEALTKTIASPNPLP
jgi:hypothetical protein